MTMTMISKPEVIRTIIVTSSSKWQSQQHHDVPNNNVRNRYNPIINRTYNTSRMYNNNYNQYSIFIQMVLLLLFKRWTIIIYYYLMTTTNHMIFNNHHIMMTSSSFFVTAYNDEQHDNNIMLTNHHRHRQLRNNNIWKVNGQTTTSTTSNTTTSTTIFPHLNDTIEMSILSSIVYHFKEYKNDMDVCDMINNRSYFNRYNYHDNMNNDINIINHIMIQYNYTTDIMCEWYYHDTIDTGTQVMIITSKQHNYITIVFAGTDDVKTALTDVDILMKPYGPNSYPNNNNNHIDLRYLLYNNLTLNDTTNIKIHSGFNYAIFHNYIMGQILTRIEDLLLLLQQHDDNNNNNNDTSITTTNNPRILTTGHSLGGASAVLTAIGMILHNDKNYQYHQQQKQHNNYNDNYYKILIPLPIISINFGCPRIGNTLWKDYIHNDQNIIRHETNIILWRMVLGWDLVPRLPQFMTHEGHTIQFDYIMNKPNVTTDDQFTNQQRHLVSNDELIIDKDIDEDSHDIDENDDDDGVTYNYNDWYNYYNKSYYYNTSIPQPYAYYQHYGNDTIGYSSVPFGWYATPYLWIPGALTSHYISRYLLYLNEISITNNNTTNNSNWINHFEGIVDKKKKSKHNNNSYLIRNDDDGIPSPPDDEYLYI